MKEVFKKIGQLKIIPVVVIDNPEHALPLAEALINGGLPCAEITFRTKAAQESIKIISQAFPQLIVGAGTVLSTQQADSAIASGARFLVTPGFNQKVVAHCIENDYPICPGVLTPSEVELALEYNLDLVKFFPAEAGGGINMLKALSGPYPTMNYIPTGGINSENIKNYLSFNKVLACGGTWMVPNDLIKEEKFKEIELLVKNACFHVNK